MSETVLEELKKRPDAVLIINRFQKYLIEENKKREEFYNLIREDIKAEFINGEIIFHSPVKMKHLRISSSISFELIKFVEENNLGFVGIEKMMIQLSRNNYEPDIVFFRKEISNKFTEEQLLFPAPDLVVEILSKSTYDNDYGIKFQDYAAHGVKEYWIVNPEEKKLEQYLLNENQFILEKSYAKNETLKTEVIKGFTLDLTKVF